jgi:hypothetical protein
VCVRESVWAGPVATMVVSAETDAQREGDSFDSSAAYTGSDTSGVFTACSDTCRGIPRLSKTAHPLRTTVGP